MCGSERRQSVLELIRLWPPSLEMEHWKKAYQDEVILDVDVFFG
jgi:hypothetical protein